MFSGFQKTQWMEIVVGGVFLLLFTAGCAPANSAENINTPMLVSTETYQSTSPPDTPLPQPTGTAKQTVIPVVSTDEQMPTANVQFIARFGKGTVEDLVWSPDGETMVVGSSTGIYFYSATTFEEQNYIPTEKWVTTLAVSSDSRLIASGETEGMVQVWDTFNRQLITALSILPPTPYPIESLAFSPDGKLIAAGLLGGQVQIWRVDNQEVIYTLKVPSYLDSYEVETLAFNLEGTMLAADSGSSIWLFDLETGQQIRTIESGSSVDTISFSPDGSMIAANGNVADQQEGIMIWDVITGQPIYSLNPNSENPGRGIGELTFSLDGSLLATASSRKVVIWSIKTEEVAYEFSAHTSWFKELGFSADGSKFAASDDQNKIWIWDIATETVIHTITSHSSVINEVSFSQNGGDLMALTENNTWQINIELQKISQTFEGKGLAFNPNAQLLAQKTTTDTIQVINLDTKGIAHILHDPLGFASHAIFSPDGNKLATVSSQTNIWDMNTGQQIKTFSGEAPVFSPDGNFLATINPDDHSINLWNLVSDQLISALNGYQGSITSISFASNTLWFFGGTNGIENDNILFLWDVSNGQLLDNFGGNLGWANQMVYDPINQIMAVGLGGMPEGKNLQLYAIHENQGQRLQTLDGHPWSVNAIVFSPDGKILASGSGGNDNSVRLWDINTGKLLEELHGHTGAISSLAFSSDGSLLVTASLDGTALLWRITP